ncbi:MAG: GIY-YIG nuclease family protein [Ignavibacteria bacterium]|nr:GIY-YIG nuclease family protein [Ignavibacteria bacterium]MBM4176396.1 GIY-YIG nuclease family protein [Ignavibacteria bacterium]
MKGWAYILECNDGSFYIGSTNNVERRIWEHENGKGGEYTSKRLPVRLLKTFEFDSVQEAFAFEHKIKKWSRKKKEALIQEDFEGLHNLAKKNFKNKS